MATLVCTYQEHMWKRNICANCRQSIEKHTFDGEKSTNHASDKKRPGNLNNSTHVVRTTKRETKRNSVDSNAKDSSAKITITRANSGTRNKAVSDRAKTSTIEKKITGDTCMSKCKLTEVSEAGKESIKNRRQSNGASSLRNSSRESLVSIKSNSSSGTYKSGSSRNCIKRPFNGHYAENRTKGRPSKKQEERNNRNSLTPKKNSEVCRNRDSCTRGQRSSANVHSNKIIKAHQSPKQWASHSEVIEKGCIDRCSNICEGRTASIASNKVNDTNATALKSTHPFAQGPRGPSPTLASSNDEQTSPAINNLCKTAGKTGEVMPTEASQSSRMSSACTGLFTASSSTSPPPPTSPITSPGSVGNVLAKAAALNSLSHSFHRESKPPATRAICFGIDYRKSANQASSENSVLLSCNSQSNQQLPNQTATGNCSKRECEQPREGSNEGDEERTSVIMNNKRPSASETPGKCTVNRKSVNATGHCSDKPSKDASAPENKSTINKPSVVGNKPIHAIHKNASDNVSKQANICGSSGDSSQVNNSQNGPSTDSKISTRDRVQIAKASGQLSSNKKPSAAGGHANASRSNVSAVRPNIPLDKSVSKLTTGSQRSNVSAIVNHSITKNQASGILNQSSANTSRSNTGLPKSASKTSLKEKSKDSSVTKTADKGSATKSSKPATVGKVKIEPKPQLKGDSKKDHFGTEITTSSVCNPSNKAENKSDNSLVTSATSLRLVPSQDKADCIKASSVKRVAAGANQREAEAPNSTAIDSPTQTSPDTPTPGETTESLATCQSDIKTISKRKCIVDKGRLSEEKVIINEATIVTSPKHTNKSKTSDDRGNKNSKKSSPTKGKLGKADKQTEGIKKKPKLSIFGGNKNKNNPKQSNNSDNKTTTTTTKQKPENTHKHGALERTLSSADKKQQTIDSSPLDSSSADVPLSAGACGKIKTSTEQTTKINVAATEAKDPKDNVAIKIASFTNSKKTAAQNVCNNNVQNMDNNKSYNLNINKTNKQSDTNQNPLKERTSVKDTGTVSEVTSRRSRSRSTRPAAPPPEVPHSPTSGLPKSLKDKPLSESYHCHVASERVSRSPIANKRNSVNITAKMETGNKSSDSGEFSDLYSDIMQCLSSIKDISPDVLKKLHDEKAEAKKTKPSGEHYYHKYDATATINRKKEGETSKPSDSMGSSVIIETMRSSCYGDTDIDEVVRQELTMPYNIVDVSTVPPSKVSPRLPDTPPPEHSSRNSSLSRSTLRDRKSAIVSESIPTARRSQSPTSGHQNNALSSSVKSNSTGSADGTLNVSNDSGMGLESVLQGLPSRYWHTYEPIKGKDGALRPSASPHCNIDSKDINNPFTQTNVAADSNASPGKDKVNARSASVENILESDSNSAGFSRNSTTRVTTPATRASITSNAPTSANVPLAHLDLSKPTSRSAENLLSGSPSPTKRNGKKGVRRSSSKREKSQTAASGGGFFSRLFGFGRKPSVDDESSEDKSPEEQCSIKGNVCKPLCINTGSDYVPTKETNLSPISSVDNTVSVSQNRPTITAQGQANISTDTSSDTRAVKNGTQVSSASVLSTKTSDSSKTVTSTDAMTKTRPIVAARTAFLYSNTGLTPAPNSQATQKPPDNAPDKTTTVRPTSASKRVQISPENTMDKNIQQNPEGTSRRQLRQTSESLSQCSLLSDGSSDARSVSSREEVGSSGDSHTVAKARKQQPKSQSALSRKMLDAPPPPPSQTDKRLSLATVESPSPTQANSQTVSITSTKSNVSSKSTTSPSASPSNASPSKTLSNPFASLRGKKKNSPTANDRNDKADSKSARPKLEISAPIALQSSTLNESQTIPRPVKKVAEALVKESRDDSSMESSARGRRFDSAAKHARNKTFTEGVDPELLRTSPESNGNSSSTDMLDSRSSNHRYQNRALPPTPNLDLPPSKHRKTVTIQDEIRSSCTSVNEDIYTDPIEEDDRRNALPSNGKSPYAGAPRPTLFGNLKPPINLLADYLEPTDNPEMRPSFVKPPVAERPVLGSSRNKYGTANAPEVLPRNASTAHSKKQNGDSAASVNEAYVSMIYVNTEMIINKTRPPVDVGGGFRAMAFINVETLLHVANTIQTEFIHQDADINQELKFSHFLIRSTKPYVNQGVVAFYNAKTYKLKPSECLLMISAKYINPDLLHHSCVHMLQPSLIFSDRILATYFPDIKSPTASPTSPVAGSELNATKQPETNTDPTKSKMYQLGAMVQTNMAVVTYHSIQSFENYLTKTIHKSIRLGEPYERTVCYLIFQILNAVLSAHDGSSLYTVKSVNLYDILVVEHVNAKDEPYLVINPLRSSDCERFDDELICRDLIKMLCGILNINIAKNAPPESFIGVSKHIKGTSRFSLGLKKFADVLEKGAFSNLLVARSIMEYVLWGPSDREMKSLLLAENREQAFCLWLEVWRCRYVNELALSQLKRNLELSHMFHFLCAVTGSSLLDVTKLLYKQA